MQRDFPSVDAIVAGVIAALDRPSTVDAQWNGHAPDPSTSGVAPWRVLNIGAGRRTDLMRFIALLEENLGREAIIDFRPAPPGDVPFTQADIAHTVAALDYAPGTPLEEGVAAFAQWFRDWVSESRGA